MKEITYMYGDFIDFCVIPLSKSPWEYADGEFDEEMNDVLDNNETYFFENYFPSIEFAKALLKSGSYVYIVILLNRYDPDTDECTDSTIVWEAGIEEYDDFKDVTRPADKSKLN